MKRLLVDEMFLSVDRFVVKIFEKEMKIFDRQAFKEFLKFLNCRDCVKIVCIWNFYGPYFPAFGLNTKR